MNTQFWKDFTQKFLLRFLKDWKEAKEKDGLIPTIDLLLEELEEEE